MERSNLFVLSIVAVVAVAGLVTVFLQGSQIGAPAGDVLVDAQGNVVGEAIRYRQFADAGERAYARQAYNPYAAKSEADLRETFVPGEQAYNPYVARPEADRRQTLVPGEGSRERLACPICRPLIVRLYAFGSPEWEPYRIILDQPPYPDRPLNLIKFGHYEGGRAYLSVNAESGARDLVLGLGENQDVDFGRFTVNVEFLGANSPGGHTFVNLALTQR